MGFSLPVCSARVQVPGSAAYQALLLPDVAIGTEQSKKYVLILGGENIVVQRYVTIGELVDGLRVIKSGLSSEDTVIVNGLIAGPLGRQGDTAGASGFAAGKRTRR